MTVVTRFAPSPTGRLHAGNLRTALFNWCLARGAAGRFLIRSEDTDTARGGERELSQLLADLAWFGLDWDGGPDRPAPEGPFRQSERGALYAEYLSRLVASNRAYACYRTDDELRRRRAELRRRGLPPRYDRQWAALPDDEVARRRDGGQQPVIRMLVTDEGEIGWEDLVRGRFVLPAGEVADFILTRSDGSPGFLFANAIDDALMGVTHVLRGEDHLVNTARQIAVLEALGMPVPHYGHMALLFGPHGVKLSKRSGVEGIDAYRDAGVLPLALANTLARLGHPWDESRLLSMAELAAGFDPARLSTATQRFDPAQINHWQRAALEQLEAESFARWAGEGALTAVPEPHRAAFVAAVRPNVLRPAEVAEWAELLYGRPALDPQPDTGADPGFFAAALAAWEAGAADHRDLAAAVKTAVGVSGRGFFKPLRRALTGRDEGPDLGALLAALPRDTVRARLAQHAPH